MKQENFDNSSDCSDQIDDSVNHKCTSCENSPTATHHHVNEDTEHATQTLAWVRKIPIGLGLCPWAGKSHSKGLLRIVTCESVTPKDVAAMVLGEVKLLVREGVPPMSTTLVACPNVKTWQEDFESFDEFVKSGIKQQSLSLQNSNSNNDAKLLEDVTLVAFHPTFLRWKSLPEGVGVGSVVQSHWGMIGSKSVHTVTATIIEINTKAFGLRKVKVRFHHADNNNDNMLEGLGRKEQFVPTDWIEVDSSDGSDTHDNRTPLPDNMMHCSPFPTIHIIVNQDLASTSIRDVSRVKRLNAQRMAKLGWEGLERRI